MGSLAFVFAGQGAQYPGMGKSLYERSPAARRAFDAAEAALPGTLKLCFEGPAEELSRTVNTQPCLFAMDYACAEAAREAGIEPDCLAGFSLGEVAAAAFGGVLPLPRALEFVKRRAEAMQACAEEHPGAMGAALRLSAEEVEAVCAEFPGVAFPVNYNCPGQTVVACAVDTYPELEKRIAERRGRMLRLNVSGAFHTPWMGRATEALSAFLANEALSQPRAPLYANCTALPYEGDMAALLSRQVSEPVRWQRSVENMVRSGVDRFVEVGAGATLSGLIRKIAPAAKVVNVESPEDLQKLKEV